MPWMANNYGDLGIVYRIRGDLDQAEMMYRKALGLFQEIGAMPIASKERKNALISDHFRYDPF